jgi:hypothetical protein
MNIGIFRDFDPVVIQQVAERTALVCRLAEYYGIPRLMLLLTAIVSAFAMR